MMNSNISENYESVRTIEKIDEVLNFAKLKKDDLMPITQTMYFKESDVLTNNYKFLQLDNNILQEIEEGQSVMFKGDSDEYAVLCTQSKTYDINETETSNSVLLMKNMRFSENCRDFTDREVSKIEVCGVFHDYLEVILGKPNLKKLKKILQETPYRGPEFEYEIDESKLFTFSELDAIIQSSTKELEKALKSMDIVIIDNKVRLLNFEYHFRVLSYMLKLIDENSWELNEINYNITLESLVDIIPKDVLVSVFEKYAEESVIIDGEQLYSYKEKEVCIFFAKVLLAQAGKFNLDEFLQAWKDSVPVGMVPDESMLCGIAIIDTKTIPHGVWAFLEADLPDGIHERFKILFEKKEKWTIPEITPYIKKLATEKLDVNALLAKYARASTIDGVKYYCAKHCK